MDRRKDNQALEFPFPQDTDFPFPPLQGAENVGISDPESPLFVAHPWSATHTTGLFTSAFMRRKHEGPVATYSITGDTTYLEAEEIRLKASLIKRERQTM